MEIKYLNKINSPDDLKKLNRDELEVLAKEIRYTLVETVSNNGGHLSSNLGVVELTIAMHKVFSSPKDQFVWDVGHQVYTHKLLTGRYDKFSTIRTNGGLSGFPNPWESEHDAFAAGHSGTSISAAYGLSVAKTMKQKDSYTVAVIGDGSFTGGLVYEALNNAGRSNTNLIVVLNDNEMSISPNVGAMAKYLAAIRTKPSYYELKDEIECFLNHVPIVGEKLASDIKHTKRVLKNYLYQSTLFEDMGFSYMGPIDGHDIDALCKALESAKGFDTPVLLHIHTKKGKGYNFAELSPSMFHGISKFDIETGEPISKGENYSSVFGKYMCAEAEANSDVCAITAAMALGTGLHDFAMKYPTRFFDVGIAEEHAVTFAGGLSVGKMLPVFAVYSTFLQRSYDEIVHDVAMQNTKVVLAVDRAGFVGEDGRSHQGLLDVAFLRTIPKSIIYSPSSYEELGIFLHKALYGEGKVVAVRFPRGKQGYLPEDYKASADNYSVYGDLKAETAIVTFGELFSDAIIAMEEAKDKGQAVKVVKLNRVWPIDERAVEAVLNCSNVFFYEEGIKSGGAGENFGACLLQKKFTGNYKHVAIDNTFVHHAPIKDLKSEFGLSSECMSKDIQGE